METCLLSSHVRQIGKDVKGLHSTLDDTLSLLIRFKCDLDNYLDHNPCQVCSTLRELGRGFAEAQRRGGGPEEPPVPTPPYQPSPLHSGIPGSPGERVEGDHIATPASLPSLIPNSSSSVSSQFADGDEVSDSDSYSLYVFTEFGHWSSQQPGSRQPGGFPGEEDSFSMGNSLPFRFNCPLLSPLTPPYMTDSPPYIPMSPEYRLASLTPPPLSPPLESLLLQTPSPTSPLALSLEDIQLPPHPAPSIKQAKKKSAPRKKNMWQRLCLHLKKVFKDYLKEFRAEEVEEEVMEQLGHSLKGRRSSGPCKACQAGGWCNNLHHCYQAMGEAGGF